MGIMRRKKASNDTDADAKALKELIATKFVMDHKRWMTPEEWDLIRWSLAVAADAIEKKILQ
jgi:hypothetical protein